MGKFHKYLDQTTNWVTKVPKSIKKPYQIYKITNMSTNEGYVGYSKDAVNRIREHMNHYRQNGSRLLRTAISLFGDQHFRSVIVDGADTKEEAIRKKKEYVKKFRTMMPLGYNQQTGTRVSEPKRRASKLTEEQVKKILLDDRKQKLIAEDYKVSESTISKIKKGKGWKHLQNR